MIEQITNLSRKSFKDYTTPPNFFKEKNILFGYNGRGKSSLALGIIDTFKASVKSETSYRLFNKDYVKDTLLLNDTVSIIKGVRVTFSKNDASIAKTIKELETQKVDVKTLKSSISDKKNNLRIEIDTIHDSNKGKAKINKRKATLGPIEVFNLYIEDLKRAREINSSDEFIASFEPDSESFEKIKQNILSSSFPQLKIIKFTNEDKDFLKDVLEKSYEDIKEIPTLELLHWLEQGIELHKDAEHYCLFCQNSFTLDDVKQRVKEYKENEKQKDIERLEKIKGVLKYNLSLLKDENKLKSQLNLINIESGIIEEIINSDNVSRLAELASTIESKIQDMSTTYSFTDSISKFELKVDRVADKIRKGYRDKIKELDDTINNIEILAKGKICLSLVKNNFMLKLIELIREKRELLEIEKRNEQIDSEINKLKEKQSKYTDFMEFLNYVLKNLGIQIKLILEDKNYYLQHTIEECKLTVDDISEGEKNLLSLLYFYFELYNDNKQTKLKKEIELIVVDDPISSLDDANKFYVLEIIKKLLSEKKIQIFVLTHSWDDFCQISYHFKNNTDAKLLEIYKEPTQQFQSAVRECATNVSPYKKLFIELYELSLKDLNSLNDCDIYHAANSMRRVFEEFLNFKKPNLLPQKTNQKEIEDIFEKATGQHMGNNRKQELGSFLSFINVLSHRPIKSDEILNNSKFIMKFIQQVDKIHFESMRRLDR